MNPFDIAWTILKMGLHEDVHGDMTQQELAQLPPEMQIQVIQGMVDAGEMDPHIGQMLLPTAEEFAGKIMPPSGKAPPEPVPASPSLPPEQQPSSEVRTGYPMGFFGGDMSLLKAQRVLKERFDPRMVDSHYPHNRGEQEEEEEELPLTDEDAEPGEPEPVRTKDAPTGPPVGVSRQTKLTDF
jgi:hypothetical protein